MKLSPEQFSSLKRILSGPAAKASALIPVSSDRIEFIIEKIEVLVRRSSSDLGGERLLLKYIPGRAGGRLLTGALIAELLANKTPIVSIDDNAALLSSISGPVSLPIAASESEKDGSLCLLCAAGQICVFAAGRVIAEIGSQPPPIQGRADWKRSWKELAESMNLHFNTCIESEKALRYWHDRKNRHLLAGPDGTEKLFHHNLFWWCNNFISDALDVYGETQAMGQDKTDITIVTEVGNIVIEVKWLGRNENNTRYAQIRIEEGIIQVADYLSRNARLMKGYLVIYDARPTEAHAAESTYAQAHRHVNCEEPIIYFLRSETPSELAVRIARENRSVSE